RTFNRWGRGLQPVRHHSGSAGALDNIPRCHRKRMIDTFETKSHKTSLNNLLMLPPVDSSDDNRFFQTGSQQGALYTGTCDPRRQDVAYDHQVLNSTRNIRRVQLIFGEIAKSSSQSAKAVRISVLFRCESTKFRPPRP